MRIPEFEIMQNSSLGAIALYNFINEYCRTANSKGVTLPYLMPILPLVFNEDCTKKICSKQSRTTSFYKAITEEKFIPIGLQDRMEEMYPQTMNSINIALGLELIAYSKTESIFHPQKKVLTPKIYNQDNLNIINASKKLGFWFAKIDTNDLCIALKIQF